MKIKRVVAAFFSATGTTEKTVTFLGEKLSEALECSMEKADFTSKKSRDNLLSFKEGDLVILGMPVIAGRVPNLMLKYLDKINCQRKVLGIPLVMFGNRAYDDGLIELRDIMEKAGIRTIGAAAMVGEHSFSDTLGKGRPNNEDMKELEEFSKTIITKVNGESEEPVKVAGNPFPYGPYMRPKDKDGQIIDFVSIKPKTKDNCTACLICANLCPIGGISFDNPKEVSKCMKCCGCIKKCPVQAKYIDDPGFIHHKEELEQYYERPAKNSFFVN